MKQSPIKRFYKKPLAIGITAALMCSVAGQTAAANFELGNFDIRFDSTFSVGASWRIEDRNWNETVGKANNINSGIDYSAYHPSINPSPINQTIWQAEGLYSTNGDAGNLNYDSGKTFSKLFKGTHELDIRNDNMGVFLRGMYFYDFEMMDESRAWDNPLSGMQSDPCRDDDAKDEICRDIRLLDAYFYGDFELGEMPFSIRIGQQVLGWGESTLISHGVSEINPIDVARLKAPGSELTEAFIPFGAVWASLGISENFNVEMFYQYNWEKSILPAPGSYFSTNDFAGSGGHYNNVQLGFSGNPDMDLDFLIDSLNAFRMDTLGKLAGATSPQEALAIQQAAGAAYVGAFPTKLTLRQQDAANEPEGGGQYGLRLSWYLPEFNETEISLYHMNYHSRRPVFSGVTADFSKVGDDLGRILTNEVTYENYTDLQSFSRVELDYAEDIKLYAMSFNTTLADTAVSGEISYRQDEPLQIDDVELLFAAMPQQLANAGLRPDLDGVSQMNVFGLGQRADGFVLSDTLQAQMTLTRFWGPMLGSNQLTTLLEVGGIDIRDMPDQDVLRLNAPGTDRNGGIVGKEGLELAIQDGVETNPFADDFAWGYRFLAKLSYSNIFAGVNMEPKVVFSHDVGGTTPDPLFLFVEDRKSISAGITFDYQSRWSLDVNYSGFWGGVGTSNRMEDSDYVSFNIKYSL